MGGLSVVVVGAGGNIGSHLVPLLAGIPSIVRVTLIDRDRYERKNLSNQAITLRDLNLPKVRVQERRLKAARRDLSVLALAMPVEQVPLGWLRADVILACLDSRAARQRVNEAAWRLGVPWIDAGVAVLDGSLLARVSVFVPGADRTCLECGWISATTT